MSANKKMVCLRMSEEDWDLLCETLEMDAESTFFDKDLRHDIREALDRIETCECPKEKAKRKS